jgi:uncharacterized protein DUF3761
MGAATGATYCRDMSSKLRLAAGFAALVMLAGCKPVPADTIPAGPGTPVTIAVSVAPPSPAPSQSPSPAPVPVVPATTAPVVAAPTTHATACAADEYRNVDGVCVHRPVSADQPPAGATAQCNDGTYSFSQHRSGTCSHHGGVRRWL